MKDLTSRSRCHADPRDVIGQLNPVLLGWGEYFCVVPRLERSPVSRVRAVAAAASASATARGPADDGGDTPPCARSKAPGYGDWKPKPDEVLAAVAALDVSAVPHGFAKKLGNCMQQVVAAGAFDRTVTER